MVKISDEEPLSPKEEMRLIDERARKAFGGRRPPTTLEIHHNLKTALDGETSPETASEVCDYTRTLVLDYLKLTEEEIAAFGLPSLEDLDTTLDNSLDFLNRTLAKLPTNDPATDDVLHFKDNLTERTKDLRDRQFHLSDEARRTRLSNQLNELLGLRI